MDGAGWGCVVERDGWCRGCVREGWMVLGGDVLWKGIDGAGDALERDGWCWVGMKMIVLHCEDG